MLEVAKRPVVIYGAGQNDVAESRKPIIIPEAVVCARGFARITWLCASCQLEVNPEGHEPHARGE